MQENKIKTLLIANRGEIAVRIIQTAKRLGIKTVAVYSDVDANAKFVNMADVSVSLGGLTSRESYLIIDKIIDACKKTNADAVHPGYGFLSENHEFVTRCEKEGIIFVGPSVKSMQMMGDKITSKETAKKAGVSVVPGFLGTIETRDGAEKVASDIGFPIIIKASAGGGGKGMKIVYEMSELHSAVESAKNEAKNAFGDDRLFIEKYIERPHHIEIQLIADKFGNVVCLGERECSIQRFNQKVIEESPSPSVLPETRQKLYDQSVKLAKECGYFSAGTIEYIMDDTQNFYFLEMNTRLQVEHPVTEYVTNKDLVELMIKVAEGHKLPFTQDDIEIRGSSIECRICAEDPSRGFIPSVGRISYYKEPEEIHNVKFRIDSGVIEGSEISPYYDSMIAKVIVHGDTRKNAIESMKKVLGNFELAGISTNMNLLEDIIRNQDFVNGKISTWFIKDKYPNGFKDLKLADDAKIYIAATMVKIFTKSEEYQWTTSGQYSLTRDESKDLVVIIGDEEYDIRYIIENDKTSMIVKNDKIDFVSSYEFGDKMVKMSINGHEKYVKILKLQSDNAIISCGGIVSYVNFYQKHIAEYRKYMPAFDLNAKTKELLSPIAGLIVKTLVSEGDVVHAGQELVVIEAMKMENILRADFDTKIKKVCCQKGQMTSVGTMLFEYDNTEDVKK